MDRRKRSNLYIYENRIGEKIFCSKCCSCYCFCNYEAPAPHTLNNYRSPDYNSNSLYHLSPESSSCSTDRNFETDPRTEAYLGSKYLHETYRKSVISPPSYSHSSSSSPRRQSLYSDSSSFVTSPMYCSTFSSRSTPTSCYSSPSKSVSLYSNYDLLSPPLSPSRRRKTIDYTEMSPMSPPKTPSCLNFSFDSPLSPEFGHLNFSPEKFKTTNFDYSPLEYPTPSPRFNPSRVKTPPSLIFSPVSSTSPYDNFYYSQLTPKSECFSPVKSKTRDFQRTELAQNSPYFPLSSSENSPFTFSTFRKKDALKSTQCKCCSLSPPSYY